MTLTNSADAAAGNGPRDLGREGETLAARFLIQRGMRIVACNVRVPVGRARTGGRVHGEIDIVAFDGPTLVFVEVKTRTTDAVAAPERAVTTAKQRRLRRAAHRYRALIGPAEAPYRFDVATVVWPPAGPPAIQLLKDFFRP
ncbi:MAG: YraN family protein [Chloracidobacterium sp.]|uniref:UPF0102 protein J8C06_09205 n=1 Tax=Chloracidobacterium validum TaxID=2821543 RepID=A0ABX8BA46_9BACT|nr:YraN family protein [Chloracidobacterium validum]QUW02518.1 YraN family protein [Chloracidobacterium validum]